MLKKISALALAVSILFSGAALANRAYFSQYDTGALASTIEVRSAAQPIVVTHYTAKSDLSSEAICYAMTDGCRSTTLTAEVAVSASYIWVATDEGIAAGDWLFLEDSNTRSSCEAVLVNNINGTKITLTTPTVKAYSDGSKVFELGIVGKKAMVTVDTEIDGADSTCWWSSNIAGSPLMIRVTGTSVCSQSASGYIGY